jgi:putative addiction module CopG family antidote
MNISLTSELERFVQAKVRSGRYSSASEVIREALRLLELQDGNNVSGVNSMEKVDSEPDHLRANCSPEHRRVLSRTTFESPRELVSVGNILRAAAFEWIRDLQKGRIFSNEEMYHFLETHYSSECQVRGSAAREPRFRNDARWAIQDAKRAKLAQDTGKSGQHQRI